ncbi:MAG: exonuclease SbcCD subunit D [Acutalibacteraceae bacterium]|nr:exonuclease SbcCD subunit D [Acutalibacteraceae bacterium]
MKFIHLSDLHLGKRVNEFLQLEDQHYILINILKIIDEQKADCVIIAGDVYDKSVPTAEAVSLFDWFLTSLCERKVKVLIISGNHDSAERLSFGNRIMTYSGVFISPIFDGRVKTVEICDNYGKINFHLLPFLKPANVRKYFPDIEINSYNDALKAVVESMNINKSERNVLVTHQFVTGAVRCESEEISVGGSDNVDYNIFDDFDYVALGHIHSPQSVGRETVRYCGTPLKYSFSEVNHKKSVTVVTMAEKGDIKIETVPLIPKRDMVKIKGDYNTLVSKNFYSSLNTDDYFHITLTDEEDIIDAVAKLRVIYPNIMNLCFDNRRTRENKEISADEYIEQKTPFELFAEFYELQNNQPLSEKEAEFLEKIIEKEEF